MQVPENDAYAGIANDFDSYIKETFAPVGPHTSFHFGYDFIFKRLHSLPGFPRLNLLDHGCGGGQFMAFLAAQGIKVTGVDISPAMLQVAREQFPQLKDAFYNVAQAEQLPSNSFDVVTSNFVLCAISNEVQLDEALTLVHRTLKPGGTAIFLSNNVQAAPQGASFVTYSTGPANTAQKGSAFEVIIHAGEDIVLEDYFWSHEVVRDKLLQTGFTQFSQFEPTLADITVKEGWRDEARYAPTVIYTAVKP